MVKLFANWFWINLPGLLQKKISRRFSFVFDRPWSRFIIAPYCFILGLSSDYLEQFQPESESTTYESYSDFFKRKYKSPPKIESNFAWPCEGYVCDWGHFKQKKDSVVKGQKMNLNSIFHSEPNTTQNYFFINTFLHNHNYHRVHSPCHGQITKILKISGDLIFLRPWFYQKNDVSYPAFRNERFIFEIKDSLSRSWYLAMIGGFGVGTIEVSSKIQVGCDVKAGQELGQFKLGSTVCLATPDTIKIEKYLEVVYVGKKLQTV